ncbi:MAG: acetyl/propionyl/methylcrotonyl-CoA carboxylase subunit alpha [Magnetococcales bacterium]|nr:acetyl/propionyl/methylcrotonyl-CoA carboxylase subunit alpha [Magnetococcales bacterium]NGZ27554.1 acetyl/propionyl/methylcrotonyl-CoA carboxylase subunit alpha [Magnetococcales bacterium]
MRKLLIANRGEIACRIIKTARRMGIATVAIYSDADHDARHVRLADEAVWVGPSASRDSYLVVENILAAIDKSGADAVHPGYGFLSENAAFSQTLRERGIVFVGPGPEAIRAMGDKIASKKLAGEAKVNTIPGHPDAVSSAEEAVEVARKIGYPVMIKASAGGGGKGMRIARNDQEAAQGWVSASNEGRSYFKDDRVFLEKFIENPRHIEIQILCDSHGNGVWLNERECSVQRRNQKVIEEAPSPFVDAAMRARMGEQALSLAKAVGYVSAGTVEFVVGKEKDFHFLEMNTRLQVEHPVTEMITGLDLVEQMIRVARGEPLSFGQAEVGLRGWAMESRIYAENPYSQFMPSTGRLVHHRPPEESRTVRVDTGVFEGGEVSIYYDPMIAKLITWGENREQAIATMRQALDQYFIEGPKHNIDFLNAVLSHPRFQRGDLSTGFIAEEYPEGFGGAPLTGEDIRFFAAVAAHCEMACEALIAPLTTTQDWVVSLAGEDVRLTMAAGGDGCKVTFANGPALSFKDDYQPGGYLATFELEGDRRTVQVRRLEYGFALTQGGRMVVATVWPPHLLELAKRMPEKKLADTSKQFRTPMPGLVRKVMVQEGQKVVQGDPLCLLEAMKMENTLCAEKDATVQKVHVAENETVEADAVLITFV